MNVFLQALGAGIIFGAGLVVLADDAPSIHQHGNGETTGRTPRPPARDCHLSVGDQTGAAPSMPSTGQSGLFESVQIETSDMRLYERFFEAVLHTPVVQHMNHPQVDSLRGYCYRGVLIVVRQDLRTPRPTGWVQINFVVSDVAALQEELERSYRASSLYELGEEERAKIVRFRFKPEVRRGDRKAVRLEVFGPEGFMIGFDQYK